MITDDALMILATAFDLQRVGLDPEGRPEQDFARDDVYFVVTEFGPQQIRLAVPLAGLGRNANALRRLLEGNCLSHESGPAQLGWSPIGDDPALVAFVDLARLDVDLFQERVTDFLIYAHYWQIEGPRLTQDGPPSVPQGEAVEMTTIRL
jgi:hypothetical protein